MLLDRVPRPARDQREARVTQPREPRPAAVDEVEDVRIGAAIEEHGVEALVELRVRVRVEIVDEPVHARVDLGGLSEVVSRDERRGEARRVALDEAERLHRVEVGLFVDDRDASADVLLEGDEVLGLEPADRLAHRHDAHVELGRDRSEDEPVPRSVLVVRDACADPVVGDLRLAAGGDGGHASGPWVSASYLARQVLFIGKSPSTGCPSATRAATQASSTS